MQLPTLDHPGWDRLLAVVACEQGPRPIEPTLTVVRDEQAGDAHDRVDDTEPSDSDIYA